MARNDTPRKPPVRKRLIWMLLLTAVVFGGIFRSRP